MINNKSLEIYINELLSIESYNDYSPNGLQIEGKEEVKNIICGVTASLDLIDIAIKKNADAIIVHHGYFWKNESRCIKGIKKKRIKKILEYNINLYAYHLPLDCHQELGNNAQLASICRINDAKPILPLDLLWIGSVPKTTVNQLKKTIEKSLDRTPLVINGGNHKINKIAWCSGAAQDLLEKAACLGADAYISGEVSERTYHEAKEYGVHYFAAGHHATERGGIMAVSKYLNNNLNINCEFIDCNNPI